MTQERAIQILENLISIDGDIIIGSEDKEALEMAIRSLQQEQQELPKIEIAEHYYHKGVYEGLSQGRADALKILEEFMKRKADPVIVIKQQEQQEVDFKIEERKWVHDAVDNIFPEDGDFMSEVDFRKILKDTARHFYELGLKRAAEMYDDIEYNRQRTEEESK